LNAALGIRNHFDLEVRSLDDFVSLGYKLAMIRLENNASGWWRRRLFRRLPLG